MCGIRAGKARYGFLAFSLPNAQHRDIGLKHVYLELLGQVVAFFSTGKAPVGLAVTIEIMAFVEAVLKSAANQGSGEKAAT